MIIHNTYELYVECTYMAEVSDNFMASRIRPIFKGLFNKDKFLICSTGGSAKSINFNCEVGKDRCELLVHCPSVIIVFPGPIRAESPFDIEPYHTEEWPCNHKLKHSSISTNEFSLSRDLSRRFSRSIVKMKMARVNIAGDFHSNNFQVYFDRRLPIRARKMRREFHNVGYFGKCSRFRDFLSKSRSQPKIRSLAISDCSFKVHITMVRFENNKNDQSGLRFYCLCIEKLFQKLFKNWWKFATQSTQRLSQQLLIKIKSILLKIDDVSKIQRC